jgi:hypothetical protein
MADSSAPETDSAASQSEESSSSRVSRPAASGELGLMFAPIIGVFKDFFRPDHPQHQQRLIGTWVAAGLLVVGIGLSPYVELEVALIALAGYLLMSIHAFLSVRVLGELRLSYMNAGPTELRLVLIALTLAMYYAGPEPPIVWQLNGFDLFVGAVGCLLVALFVIQTVQVARRLAVEEPPRN